MITRNDACPCGSGKKYKKCCINQTVNPTTLWKQRALTTASLHSDTLTATYFAVFDHSIKKSWRGACHAISGILYVLLREQGIETKRRLGFAMVEGAKVPFCHSWVEIDGQVYDSSLYRPNATGISTGDALSAPIFNGIDLSTGEPSDVRYGVKAARIDRIYEQLSRSTFGAYMDGWPQHKDGLWGEACEIGDKLGLTLKVGGLRERYAGQPFKH
ncbi:SEC-C metal-binding domain-containing protein [Metabacillus sp. SLBN-84]